MARRMRSTVRWRAARFDLVTSTAQLNELRRVSRYPKLKLKLKLKLKIILPAHRVGQQYAARHRPGYPAASAGRHRGE